MEIDTKKTRKLLSALRENWPYPNHAFIAEFRGGTGYGRESRADAIAMDLWPSNGLNLVGFELKSSYTDLMKELNDLSKCEPIKQFCDEWYLVLADEHLLYRGNVMNLIPDDWGIMHLDYRGKIVTKKKATKLTSKPADRLFLASLMRLAAKDFREVFIDGRKYVSQESLITVDKLPN